MQLKQVTKEQIEANAQNPRLISEKELAALVQSLIDFPEMLMIRPITIGTEGITLGGNQRFAAINEIRDYTSAVKTQIMDEQLMIRKEKGFTPEQVKHFKSCIQHLLYDDFFFVLDISHLSKDQQEEFIIKDNVSYGTWDYEALNKLWEKENLNHWGLEIPKWAGEKEETNREKEITEEHVETAHVCPNCGFEFN